VTGFPDSSRRLDPGWPTSATPAPAPPNEPRSKPADSTSGSS